MTTPKDRARKAARQARKAAHAADLAAGHTARDAATQTLLAQIATLPDGPVAGYMPIHSEIDPRPAMAALHAQGRAIALPVIAGPARPLLFHRWTPGTPLVDGPFGAKVPADGLPLTPCILIVPLLAFDRCGMRLGYGGGFYDRTLARLRARDRQTCALGFAFEAQLAAQALPTEPTDAPLDAIVTEAGLHTPAP